MRKLAFCFVAVAVSFLGCQDGLEMNAIPPELSTHVQALGELGIHIDQEILKCMDNPSACDERLDIVVVFDDAPEEEPIEDISFEVVEGEKYLNGKKITEKDERELYKRLDARRAKTLNNMIEKRESIIKELNNLGINLEDKSSQEYIKGNDALHVELSLDDIVKLSKSKSVLGIELFDPPKDTSLATAMLATYVTQGASFQYNLGGQNIGVYMSESGCPASGYISNYTLISGSQTAHSRNVSAILRAVSPKSHIYCKAGCTLPDTSMIETGAQGSNPDIFFANFSCSSIGNGTYAASSKSYDDFIYNTGLTIMNSAANEGNNAGYVGTQGFGMNVITVGNYNDYSNTPASFAINSSSSYKNATNTKSAKPEVSAPGTSINAGTYESGGTITMTGTSQATPHVTGMMANTGSEWTSPNYNSITPPLMRVMLLNGARDSIQGGYDKVGVGGIDYYKTYNINVYSWIKGNYASIAANDGNDNGVIDRSFTTYSSTTKVRLVISWLNRGTWVYAHKDDPFPAGADYGFIVYDPDGDVVATHWNPFDGFAVIDFDTPKVGEYKFQINRTANRDTSATLNMAWGVTFN